MTLSCVICVKLQTFTRHQSIILKLISLLELKNCPLHVLICAFQKDTSKSATLRKSLVPAGSSCDEMKGVYFLTFLPLDRMIEGMLFLSCLSVCLSVVNFNIGCNC